MKNVLKNNSHWPDFFDWSFKLHFKPQRKLFKPTKKEKVRVIYYSDCLCVTKIAWQKVNVLFRTTLKNLNKATFTSWQKWTQSFLLSISGKSTCWFIHIVYVIVQIQVGPLNSQLILITKKHKIWKTDRTKQSRSQQLIAKIWYIS